MTNRSSWLMNSALYESKNCAKTHFLDHFAICNSSRCCLNLGTSQPTIQNMLKFQITSNKPIFGIQKTFLSPKQLFIKTNNNYYCALCSANGGPSTAHNVKTVAIHLKNEHNEKILICEHCDAVFRRRTEYNHHLDQHVAQELTDFRCDVCQTKFNNIRALRMHRKNHVATPKVWSCEVCEKKYSSKNLLDEHMNMHSGKRPFKCSLCPKVGYLFARKRITHTCIHTSRTSPPSTP